MLKNLLFLGSPGAGKGSVAARAKSLGFTHISTGDIFRENIKNGTGLGLQVQAILASGGLVSDELTNELVKERFKEDDVKNGFILDGYPRTIAQAKSLEDMINIEVVINFEINKESVVTRLQGRRTCRACGAIYNVANLPASGKCDCSGELFTRPDDEVEAIERRLAVYNEKTAPLIEYYKEQGKLRSINAEKLPDEVFEEFKKIIGLL